ncbi:unnamed protein product [Mortierella alpina]
MASTSAGTSSSSAGTFSSSAGASSSSAGTSSSSSTTATTTSANAAAEPAKDENKDDEESTDAVQPTLTESAEAAVPTPLESSPSHSLAITVTQLPAVSTTLTTQPIPESSSQSGNQDLTPVATRPTPTSTLAELTTPSSFVSTSSQQPNASLAIVTSKRKRLQSEDADVEDDLTVDEPSHKKRSRSLERAFAVTPPPSTRDWGSASPSTSPHLTSDSSGPSSPAYAQHSFGYISDDSWTHPTTPTSARRNTGLDMSQLYVPPSNVIETGAEDDLEKMLFADIPLTEMADLQAFSAELDFGLLNQGDDLDQLLFQQMGADDL